MKTIGIISGIAVGVFAASQVYVSWSTARTEQQPYKVVDKRKGYEIRHYPATTMAQVRSTANTYKEMSSPGFRQLAGYIFGGNASGTQIAMTAPVHMDFGDSGSTMAFVMPAGMDSSSLPRPNNENVEIRQVPEEYVAVARFGGYASDEAIDREAQALAAALRQDGIAFQGHFRFLGYNPPYQVFGRRNEVIVRIAWPQG